MRVHHVHSIVLAGRDIAEVRETFKKAGVEYIDRIMICYGESYEYTFFFDGENAIKLRRYLYSIGDMDSMDAERMSLEDMMAQSGAIIRLTCCCCGKGLIGRQWHNRDTGYGLCSDCIKQCRVDDVVLGGTSDSYGVRGIHWDITQLRQGM